MTHWAPLATSAVALREAPRARDVEAVREIVRATGMFGADEIAIAADLVEEALARGPDSGYRFHFAEADARLLGYACHGPIPLTRDSFDLYWIAVHPHHQRRGLGARLLAAAEAAAARAGASRLYVDTSGRAAYARTRAFYERSGYQLAASLADFYGPGDAKWIYVKRLGAR
ncbi:MAG TPA: GNAT family N-acetyltransferase [Myxococcota bacterium]|nr:GNAT family N-acetyltransferase [Myxococcota bacterium]